MRWWLVTGAVQLALVGGAAALSPAAGLELAPEAGVSPQPASWRQHSHSVLKDLVAPSAAAWLDDTDDERPRPHRMAAPAPPPEVPTQPPQSRPLRLDGSEEVGTAMVGDTEQLRGWGHAGDADEDADIAGAYNGDYPGGDFCNGRPIYDGPATSWEDCRAKCRPPCKFWSFGRESVQPRCKLAIQCGQREQDSGRVNVSVYADVFADSQAASDTVRASSTAEPREEAAPEVNETELQRAPNSRQTCSPQGSAKKFAISPEFGGRHDIGVAHHYADCASAASSMGYGSIAWNTGSKSSGRCYAFASDVPEIAERSCEDAPPVHLNALGVDIYSTALSSEWHLGGRFSDCWLFGPTSCD
jgi:hypothetical protein